MQKDEMTQIQCSLSKAIFQSPEDGFRLCINRRNVFLIPFTSGIAYRALIDYIFSQENHKLKISTRKQANPFLKHFSFMFKICFSA